MTETFSDGVLAIVCDGMGGMQNGADASKLAIEAAGDTFRGGYQENMNTEAVCALLRESTIAANQAVYHAAVHGPARIRMGSTLVGAFVREQLTSLVNVGDSRAYLIAADEGDAMQLTLDHTVVQLLYERGDIEAEERATHPRRNELTRAIGVSYRVLPDIYQLQVRPDDKLLLCSDGLYNFVSTEKIAEIVRKLPPDEVPAALVAEANANGGKDNISVILLAA